MTTRLNTPAPVTVLLLGAASLGAMLFGAGFCGAAQAQANAFAGQVPVNASLKKELDSKYAKVGNEVDAKMEKAATIDGTLLPKDTMLVGHVVDVVKHSKTTPNGSVTVFFDHAQPRKGAAVAIRASVYSISPSEDQLLAQRTDVDVGMRGSAEEQNSTSALREVTDRNGRSVSAVRSAVGAPVLVVSAVPGVALSAVSGQDKSGIMTARNGDVDLGAGLELVVGVALK